MNVSNQLIEDGVLSAEEAEVITQFERNKPMSVHWELRTILYLGILLMISGISLFVYQHIDTIGHTVVIAAIAIACGTCFYFSTKNRQPYSHNEVKNASPFFDYIVLLGALLFGVFIAYIQFQYAVFGTHYGIATLLPSLLYLVSAYLFDHKGVLSLGITGLAAWAGISVTPSHLLGGNDFDSLSIILISLLFGATLATYAFFADRRGIKKHFGFTYNNFACNILCVALLVYLFDRQMPLHNLASILLGAVSWYYIRYAIIHQSFWFLLLTVIYAYIGITYVFFWILLSSMNSEVVWFGFIYTLLSCGGIVYFLRNHKRILKIKK